MIRRPQRPTLSPSAPLSLSNPEDSIPAANDGLGIPAVRKAQAWGNVILGQGDVGTFAGAHYSDVRSEEHTSELQSHLNLVCRLLLEKKKPPPRLNTHHRATA